MANENAAMTSTYSFTLPEWLKSFNGAQKNPYGAVSREALGFTASRLQEQADHLKNLAECADFAEAMKCQFEFAQQSWSRSLGEAWNVFDHLRVQSSSGSS
jgi:phasin protein